jgi:YmgG-like glycine-zipper protein
MFAHQRASRDTPQGLPCAVGMALALEKQRTGKAALHGDAPGSRDSGGESHGREDDPMNTTRVMRMMAAFTLLTIVATGCGTLTGAAIGAGSGAAIGAGTGNTGRGALIGTGVGAAAGAIYDATRPYPSYSQAPYSRGGYRRW